jgi:hypothetical protein
VVHDVEGQGEHDGGVSGLQGATSDRGQARPVKLTNQQVGRAGEHFVAAEIHRRGGYAVMFTGNMPGIDMLASNRDNTHRVSIQVKTKGPNSGGWQTSTRHGLSRETADSALFAGRFWVLVDLRPANPGFYVMPELWIRNDIYERHQEYLARHGGHRRDNPASEHHLITIARVAERQDAWDVLGIDLMSPSSTR